MNLPWRRGLGRHQTGRGGIYAQIPYHSGPCTAAFASSCVWGTTRAAARARRRAGTGASAAAASRAEMPIPTTQGYLRAAVVVAARPPLRPRSLSAVRHCDRADARGRSRRCRSSRPVARATDRATAPPPPRALLPARASAWWARGAGARRAAVGGRAAGCVIGRRRWLASSDQRRARGEVGAWAASAWAWACRAGAWACGTGLLRGRRQ
ncbi:hypothetical protein HYPSUDRAFT_1081736 [Hypholoma sublateritium FD-334 SS-4]|uniref:Uncharacterized protein n=1 Tax=Hypholoma sublateritium (strain FD-334 SS-4) TaxID=945553 RepID=A0A0D2N8J0_HYPSF|nr:hypothetical protein HYPSUDRAFT_1081736 [Hypholoma sublateritium FD-334 SS-4]